jgi:hypothetical protein
MRSVTLEGKRWAMRDIHRLYKEQKDARKQTQLQLFELKVDARPVSERTAAARYTEPTFFSEPQAKSG